MSLGKQTLEEKHYSFNKPHLSLSYKKQSRARSRKGLLVTLIIVLLLILLYFVKDSMFSSTADVYTPDKGDAISLLDDIDVNDEDQEFWDFISTLNKVSDKSKKKDHLIFNAKGTAHDFNYAKLPEKSITLSKSAVINYIDTFTSRYAWVGETSRYEVDKNLLSNLDFKSVEDLSKHSWFHLNLDLMKNPREFEAAFLSYVLVADYLASEGSKIDKLSSLRLLGSVFSTTAFLVNRDYHKENRLIFQVARDIFHPLMDDHKSEVTTSMTRNIYGFYKSCNNDVEYINYLLWLIKSDLPCLFDGKYKTLRRAYFTELTNTLAQHFLPEYKIYIIHRYFKTKTVDDKYTSIIKYTMLKRLKDKKLYNQYIKLKNEN